jgi:hypothetical protein
LGRSCWLNVDQLSTVWRTIWSYISPAGLASWTAEPPGRETTSTLCPPWMRAGGPSAGRSPDGHDGLATRLCYDGLAVVRALRASSVCPTSLSIAGGSPNISDDDERRIARHRCLKSNHRKLPGAGSFQELAEGTGRFAHDISGHIHRLTRGWQLSFLRSGRQVLCRVADAGHSDASTGANSRRRQLAKGRNRGRWSAEGAAGAMGI